MASRNKRVMKEIQDCQRDSKSTQINIKTIGEDLTNLRGFFPGPTDSPYEGGTFEVAIEVPAGYPFQPLKMKFVTKVYHPNISSQSGAICLDILKDAWSPVLTLKTTLVSLQSLLCSPEPHDPQDAEVANVYLRDRSRFDRTARSWTEQYAGGKAKAKPEPQARLTQASNSKPSSTMRSSSTLIADDDSGVEVISGLNSTPTNPTGGSSSHSNPIRPNRAPESVTQSRLRFNRDVEDQILNFELDRDLIVKFQTMGFEIESIIGAMIDLKLNDDRGPQSATSFPTVLEALLH